MLRLVLDTNVLVSAFLNPRGTPAKIFEGCLERRWELLGSGGILNEYEAVLNRRKFGLSSAHVRETMRRLEKLCLMIFPTEIVRACSDSADDKFIECGFAGKATHLVTGNIRHFPKEHFLPIRIVTPALFAEQLL